MLNIVKNVIKLTTANIIYESTCFKSQSKAAQTLAPTPHLRGPYPSYEGQVHLILGVGKQHF